MTDEVSKPGPVDTAHRDPAYAAQPEKEPKQETQEQEVTEQTVEEESGEQNESEQTAASEDAQDTRKKGVAKRIDELTKNWRDTERDRDHWRELAMRAQKQEPQPQVKQEVQASTDDPEPTLEDVAWDVPKYTKEWHAWQKRQEKREADREKQAETQKVRVTKLQESAAAFSATTPDFNDVVYNPNLPVTDSMMEVISESDNPAAVAYWLGKNVEEARKIASMTPAGVGRAIARIESQLERVEPEQRQPTQKTVTQAPPPPTTLSGNKVPSKKFEEMTMAEYDAERRRQREAKGLRP